jgi:hypothetical protein
MGTVLARLGARPHDPGMFTVTKDQAAAIRAAFEHGGEFSAAVEVRRLFPAIIDNAEARAHARIIAGWAPPAPGAAAPGDAAASRKSGAGQWRPDRNSGQFIPEK